MMKSVLVMLLGLLCGAGVVFFMQQKTIPDIPSSHKPTVLGFMPYWQINTEKDYTPYVDTVAYFGLTVEGDGTIQKETNPGESEPGWYALKSGKFDTIPKPRSLVLFGGDQEKIGELISNPVEHANTLMKEISPLLDTHQFSDLNIDIESVSIASPSAQQNFTLFVKTIRETLQKREQPISMSIDVSPTALILPYLIDVKAIAPYVDTVIFMTYDFHYQGSMVTGAVAPQNGAGTISEYDVETSVKEALKILPPEKIILGVPLYGYEWEALSDYPRAAVIPGTGITASNKRVEELLSQCSTCSAQFDPVDKESYVIYKNTETNTFHHIFYPDARAIEEKIKLVNQYKLGGIALWALGYEGATILDHLKQMR